MKLLLLGDVHGDTAFIKWAYKQAEMHKADRIVQLGDLAWAWPRGKWRANRPRRINKELRQTINLCVDATGIPFTFLAGNHDNYDELPEDGPDPVVFDDGITYLPRGCHWTWGAWDFAAIGGAYSIDKNTRMQAPGELERQGINPNYGFTWWEREVPPPTAFDRIIDLVEEKRGSHRTLDVLLTHEAPGGYYVQSHHAGDEDRYPTAYYVRKGLRAVVDATRPKLVFHGHHHHHYRRVLNEEATPTTVVGLNASLYDNLADWLFAIEFLEVPE